MRKRFNEKLLALLLSTAMVLSLCASMSIYAQELSGPEEQKEIRQVQEPEQGGQEEVTEILEELPEAEEPAELEETAKEQEPENPQPEGMMEENGTEENAAPEAGDAPIAEQGAWSGGSWSLLEDGTLTISGTGTLGSEGGLWSSLSSRCRVNLVIEEGITEIGRDAFQNCSIESVKIPGSVRAIGAHAFGECYSLEKVEIKEGVKTIGVRAFASCAFKEIAIPGSVEMIRQYAFSCCSLTKIEIQEGVKTIGAYAFERSGLKSVTIPGSVEIIGKYAFSGCPLTELEIGEGVKIIGKGAFARHSIKSVTIPGSVEKIDKEAFRMCSQLTEVVMPDSVGTMSIGQRAFENCRKLTQIKIPNGTVSIGRSAFGMCRRLTQVTIPDSVQAIGESAFSGCRNLGHATVGAGITELPEGIFSGDGKLTDLQLPDTITSIGRRALQGTGVTELPAQVTDVAYAGFASTALEDLDLSNVANVGDYAFAYCKELKNVKMGEKLTKVSGAMFSKDSKLTAIELPDSISSVGAKAFKGTSIKSIQLPANVTEIAYETFKDCTALESIDLSKDPKISSIGSEAFSGTSLKNMEVPSTVTEIAYKAFGSCTALEAVTLGEGLKNIGEYAFSDCTGLTPLTVPQNVEKMEKRAYGYYKKDSSEGTENISTSEWAVNDKAEIVCQRYSEGHRYAIENNIPVSLKEDDQKDLPEIQGVTAENHIGITTDGQVHSIKVNIPEGARISYSTDGITYTEENPSFTERGKYTVYYKVEKDGCRDKFGSASVVIRYPAIEGITAKGCQVIFDDTDKKYYQIQVNAPEGAQIRYSTDGETYRQRNPRYYPRHDELGEHKVYYKVRLEGHENYIGHESVIFTYGEIEGVSANGYKGMYDGKPHSIEVTFPEGAAVSYSLDKTEEKTYVPENPSFTDAGSYTVYYKVTKENFLDAYGSAEVVLEELTFEGISANGYEGYYDGQAHSIEVTAPEGTEVTYSQDTAADKTYTAENPAFTEAGTYTVYYKVTRANYKAYEGLAQVIIHELLKFENVSANGYNGYYDGKGHSIEVTVPEGAEVAYSQDTSENKTYTAQNPVFTEIGTYTVYYKVTKANYEDMSGSAQVVISKKPVTIKPKKKGTQVKDSSSKAQYVVKKPGTVKKGKVTGAEVAYKAPTVKKGSVQIPATVKVGGITYKVTAVADNAFKNNQKLTTVKMSGNVTTIGSGAFSGCKKLRTVTIGAKVTAIGKNAFSKCTSLSKVTLPASVKSVGQQAFSGCKKLKTITIKTSRLTAKNVGGKAFSGIYKKATVKVPKKKVTAYKKLLKSKGLPKTAKVK